MYLPTSKWTWTFFLLVVGQAMIGLAMEAYVFGRFLVAVDSNHHDANVRAIDTYLSLFIFGFLYEIGLTWDALRLKNTIQIIGLCLYNIGLMIYAAVQTDQIRDAVLTLGPGVDTGLWPVVRPYLIAVPCILALGTVLMAFVAWKLYDEFAWSIYKHISADLGIKRRYLVYQVYITLLKFDFFFFLSFTVQFLVVVLDIKDIEFGLTLAAIPVTILILISAGYWTRRESIPGMLVTIILYFAGLAYYLFKLIRAYDDSTPNGAARVAAYLPARRGLTTFAAITILLLVATIANAVWCTFNFDKGLKPHLMRRKVQDYREDKMGSVAGLSGSGYGDHDGLAALHHHGTVPLGQMSQRMTID